MKSQVNDGEPVECEWNEKELSFKVSSGGIDSVQSNAVNAIVCSSPYIKFTAFSTEFRRENPNKYLQSVMFGNFINFKEDSGANLDLMLNLFEPTTPKLKCLKNIKLSTEQMNKNCVYDELHREKLSKYEDYFEYFDKFIENFEKDLIQNVTKNENNFCNVLKFRLFPQNYFDFVPMTL